jgi:uncharacterized repeat protein (TIGR02543 family)
MQESEGRAMKKTLSRIMVLLLAMVMVITSALAVFADTESVQPADEGMTGGAPAEEIQEDGNNGVSPDEGQAGSVEQISNEQPGGQSSEGEDPEPAATYTVTWRNQDGTGEPIEVDEEVAAGSQPVFDGKEPAKASDGTYNYTFEGWAEEPGSETGKAAADLPEVTGNITYYAAFSKKEIPHTHSYGEWTVTVKPTYFKTGKKVRKCSCGETQTQTVAKLTAKNKWIKDNNKWYYFGSNGKVYSGWQKMKARGTNTVKWLYFTPTGIYWKSVSINTKNKWVYAGGYKFYFTKYKKPAGPGFNFVNSKLYHMNKLGGVMYGKFKAKDGYTYTTAKDGTINGVPYYRIRYKTFVLVDISDQTIWYYQNGKQKLKSDVVTGTKGRTPTPTGVFKVRSKLRNINLVGPTWNSHVRYWMAFKGSAYGLHDASWRTSKQFSNHKTYLKNGSHGCVNLRPSFAGKLYNSVKRGTVVIIRK